MGMEIPMDLINQLQISLRREAKLASYDPGGSGASSSSAFPSLPSAADAIAELDASPSYLGCRNCKGKLLRGIDSLMCVFCGKQQRTTDNPPDPIKFTSTCGYRWLLGALNLDGSEMVEPLMKEMTGSSRGRNAPIEATSVSKLLDLEIQWGAADEKFANVGMGEGKSIQSRIPLDLGGLDLDNFFVEGRTAVSDAQMAEREPVEDDFKDPRSFSLFENVESQGLSEFQWHRNGSLLEGKVAEDGNSSREENLSLFVGQDAQLSASPLEHGNLSLFERKNIEENISSKGLQNLGLFEGKDAKESVSFKEDQSITLFEGLPSSNVAVESVGDKPVDSSSDWDNDFQSAPKQNLSREQKPVDTSDGPSVDLATHMDTVFGSGISKDSRTASVSNASDWLQDDLFGNVIDEAKKNDGAVHARNGEQVFDQNGTSMNIDWIQDDLWQTGQKKASNRTPTDEDDEWNDFESSADSKAPNDSLSQTGVTLQDETFDGMTHLKNGGKTKSRSSFRLSVDWTKDEKQNPDPSMVLEKTKDQVDDLFGNWNDFTSSTASRVPVQHSTDHVNSSIEQASDLFGGPDNDQGLGIGSFSQSDFFSGGFISQSNSAEAKILRPKTSSLDRTADPASKDQTLADYTSNDLFGKTSMSNADAAEELMSQMHDLSFMLETKLSVPRNSNT